MAKYLISFAADAMDHITEEEGPAVGAAAHAVLREAKESGVWFWGGGVDEAVPPVKVNGDGTVSPGAYPLGGMSIIDVPTHEDAVHWAAKFAVACRCPQTLIEIGYDPLV